MIDLARVEQYRENNRIEAKKALGGLPKSIWETYSAFANTLGGMLLLGVEERPDHSLHAVDLPQPQRLIDEFWQLVNDPKKVSFNLLSPQHVRICRIDGKRIIAIEVPRASRCDRPIYIDADPLRGTYCRRGEGDFRCTPEEVRAMQQAAAQPTQDMQPLPACSLSALDDRTLHRYRARMRAARPGHVWNTLPEPELLAVLGAAAHTDGGALCPTAAGLLMLGRRDELLQAFPACALDYQRWANGRLQTRLFSGSGDWSGNLFDFYRLVCRRLSPGRAMQGADAPVYAALREALVNCLVNADYHGRGGIRIVHTPEHVLFSNPGGFCVDVGAAMTGGVSRQRNAALGRMFQFIGVGRSTGSGIPGILDTWSGRGWAQPSITVLPGGSGRTTLTLPLGPRPALARRHAIRVRGSADVTRRLRCAAILDYLTVQICADEAALAEALALSPAAVRRCLDELLAEGVVTQTDGGFRLTSRSC